jgi:hypothetical protein
MSEDKTEKIKRIYAEMTCQNRCGSMMTLSQSF